ncbi:hypothetical protein PM082_012098 [Marasmius tenuissimus]|nr:hypothetical protein PM082_012098 [Marasmius tenuissimus]
MSEHETSPNQPATTNPTHNRPSSRPESSINLGAGSDKAARTSFPSERGVKPENWEGDHVKTNRFVNKFRNYLALNEDRYPTVVDQQALFLSLLGGDIGAAWADRCMEEIYGWGSDDEGSDWGSSDSDHQDNNVDPAGQQTGVANSTASSRKSVKWPTLDSLLKQFKKDFAPLDPKGKAQTAIETITMTGDLADIDKYISEFERHAAVSKLGEEALLLFFKRGLHPKLVDRVSGTYPRPKGLEGYKKRAVELQNEYLSRRAEAARWKNTRLGNYVTCSQTTTTSTTTGRVAADAGASKEVNAFKAPGASSPLIPLKKLTPEERQWCVDKGLCFRCRQPGHQGYECPTFPPTNQRSGQFIPIQRPTGTNIRATTPGSFSSSVPSSSTVPPSFSSTPMNNLATTSPFSTPDYMKEITETFNNIQKLDPETKAAAAAHWRDLGDKKDF